MVKKNNEPSNHLNSCLWGTSWYKNIYKKERKQEREREIQTSLSFGEN